MTVYIYTVYDIYIYTAILYSHGGKRPAVCSAVRPAGGGRGAYQAWAISHERQFVFIVLGLERTQSPNNDWLRTEGGGGGRGWGS